MPRETAILAGGVALHALDLYVATTMLPSVVQDIGGLSYYAWNTTLFVVASIAGSATSARLLGRLGPRGAYVLASLAFAAGALLCAVASDMRVFVAGRTVQGLGAGLLLSLAYAMVRVVFAPERWPRAMAMLSGMWGVATLLGPLVGGVFAQRGAWRGAFGSLAAVMLAFAGLSAVILSSTRPSEPPRRLLPRGALDPRTPLGALYVAMALLAMGITSSEVFVPLFLQTLHGLSPLAAGYFGALMAGGWTLGSLASAGWGPRAVRHAMRGAPALMCIAMATLGFLLPIRGTACSSSPGSRSRASASPWAWCGLTC